MDRSLRLILGDQLSPNISSLNDADPATDIIVMAELWDEATYVRHHQKKLAFIFSAMRHFAEELRAAGFVVDYRQLDHPEHKAQSFTEVLIAAIEHHQPQRVIVTEPGEWRVRQMMNEWASIFDLPVHIRADDRFLADHDGFARWAEGRKTLRMEFFYREMRKATGYLMEDGKPVGGQWNYDAENRAPPKEGLDVPHRPSFAPDDVTNDVIATVADRFGNNFGSLAPFNHPVSRADAEIYLDWFIDRALPQFGTYQDAMVQGEPLMFHSHLSALINIGLLDPRVCCERAEQAWREGHAPLNAVEGFIRQIIGWREFIRGIYWLKMPDYADSNTLNATCDLPDWFWTGETQMNCLRQAITETRENAYAHHIQRLMVIGNFALLAGLDPRQVQEWFLIVYHDAYEWVEMPNVLGMALYADGGVFASKPYAASGAYINRMSNYCGSCRYAVSKKNGPKACPFNYLYWDFLARNTERLRGNQRMAMIYKTLERMTDEKRAANAEDARRFLNELAEA